MVLARLRAWFPDRMPGHRGGPGAKKVLRPADGGYDEVLRLVKTRFLAVTADGMYVRAGSDE